MTYTRSLAVAFGALCLAFAAQAQNVSVSDAWARATVAGQKATGVFMKLTAKDGAKLVGASSPVAGVTGLHEMKMDKDVMKMGEIPALDLPAGQTVELKPGSYHVMLMDLKQTLAVDSTVPLTLTFQDAKGNKSQLELKVPVRQMAAGGGGMSMSHDHDHAH